MKALLRRSLTALLVLALCLPVASCDSSGSNESLPLGTMRAQVNGNDWRATGTAGAVLDDQSQAAEALLILGISGEPESLEEAVQLGVVNPDPPSDFEVTPGTYRVDQEGVMAFQCEVSENADEFCRAEGLGAAETGEIEIESIGDETVQGRFEFETTTTTVAGGRFHLSVSRPGQ